MEQYGQIGGFALDGNFMFGCLVTIVNIKVLISSKQVTFWSVFMVSVSILSFYLIFFMFSCFEFMTTTGQFQHTWNRLQSWFCLILVTFSYILTDSGQQMANSEIEYLTKRRIT